MTACAETDRNALQVRVNFLAEELAYVRSTIAGQRARDGYAEPSWTEYHVKLIVRQISAQSQLAALSPEPWHVRLLTWLGWIA